MGPEMNETKAYEDGEARIGKAIRDKAPIELAVEEQEQIIVSLQKSVDLLDQRLTPVSSQQDEALSDADKEPSRGNSPMIGMINNNNASLNRLRTRLNRMTRNLEV